MRIDREWNFEAFLRRCGMTPVAVERVATGDEIESDYLFDLHQLRKSSRMSRAEWATTGAIWAVIIVSCFANVPAWLLIVNIAAASGLVGYRIGRKS